MAILKRWTGSIWTPARRILYWNGSAWVEKNFKYWDGSAWRIAVTKEGWVDDYVKGLWHINEGSGTSSADSSGNGHTMNWGQYAEAERPVWMSGGKPGWGGLAFNVKHANVAYHSDFDFGTNPFTVEAWIHGGYTRPQNEVVIGRYSTALAWWLGYSANTGYPMWAMRNEAGTYKQISWASNIHNETWHYVVGVKDATYMRLYIDGTERANDTHPGGSYNHGSANVNIGWLEGTGHAWDYYAAACNMGELRISKGIARTPQEILDVWNANA